MAATLPQSAARRVSSAPRRAEASRELSWRLVGAGLIGLAVTIFIAGTAWDIQWHTNVGRDRVLTPPHLLILGGIALAGLISLALILRESYRTWRGLDTHSDGSIRLLGVFHAPLGLVTAGSGALLGAIAFPLDDYWHTLYGIDVTLWAPFHVMIISSMVMSGLGALYVQAAALHEIRPGWTQRLIQLGFAALLAITLAALLLFLPQANVAEGLMQIGGYDVVLYPVLVALALPLGLLTALLVTRQPGMATAVALVFLALRQLLFWFVPWAMDVTVAAEGLSYRVGATDLVITPYAYPATVLLAALLLDGVAVLVQRRGGSERWLLLAASGAALVPALLDRPWVASMTGWYYPTLDTDAALWHTVPLIVVSAALGAGAALLLSRSLTAGLRAETHELPGESRSLV